MLKNAITRFSYGKSLELILGNPVAIVVVVLAITLFFTWQIPRLSFQTSVYDLQIEDLPETIRYQEFKKLFGSDEIIRVVIKSENSFDPAIFSKVTELSDATAKIDGVRRVVSLPVIKKAVDLSGSWSLEKFHQVVSHIQLFRNNLLSDDGKTTALTLVLKHDADLENVIASVNELIAATGKDISLYQIGMPLVSQALAQLTQKDFLHLPPLTFLVIGVVLIALFRKLRYVFIPFACVGLGLIWTFGLMALARIPLSMLTMIVPVFLIAVGTAYCLHIVSEYITAAEKSETSVSAARETFTYIYFPTSLAVLTTIIGLGSLLVNRIPTIREFAVFACFGMFSILIMALTFLPAVLSLLPAPVERKNKKSSRLQPTKAIIEKIVDLDLNHQKVVLPLIAAVTVVCLAGISQLRVETNPVGYFKADTPVKRNFDDIYHVLSGSFPINIVMAYSESDYFESPEAIAGIARIQEFLETLPGVDKSVSFADYLRLVNYASNRFEPEFYRLPEQGYEVRMLMNSYATMLGQDMFDRFMNSEMSKANIVLLTHISSSSDFINLRDKIFEHVAANFSKDLQWEVTGFGMSIAASSHRLTNGQIKSLSITMVLVFGIMFLLFLSGKVGLIAIIPNLFPIIINFGIMGWFGIELSMVTSLIASIAIGLAVDDTIHYLVRYNKEFRKDLDDERALRDTLLHVGRPIIYTTVTVSLGFAVLLFSGFKPTAVFGSMMVITMLSALVGDLILLPSLMQHVELVTLWDLVRLKLGKEPAKGIPLFKGLSRAEVHSIIMAGSLKTVEPGEVLFHKGDPSDSMYAIIAGSMDVIDPGQDDDACLEPDSQRCINTMQAGEVLGEMGLLRSAPRSATVVAREPVELLPINWKIIKRLQWLYPPTAQKLMNNLLTIVCDRVERLTTCLADVQTQMDERRQETRPSNPEDDFFISLEQEVERARQCRTHLALSVFSISYEAGDPDTTTTRQAHSIQSIANTLKRNIRATDILKQCAPQRLGLLLPQVQWNRPA